MKHENTLPNKPIQDQLCEAVERYAARIIELEEQIRLLKLQQRVADDAYNHLMERFNKSQEELTKLKLAIQHADNLNKAIKQIKEDYIKDKRISFATRHMVVEITCNYEAFKEEVGL